MCRGPKKYWMNQRSGQKPKAKVLHLKYGTFTMAIKKLHMQRKDERKGKHLNKQCETLSIPLGFRIC